MYVNTQLSEDVARRAAIFGPHCHDTAIMRQRSVWFHDQSSVALRTTICRQYRGNTGYTETRNRL